MKKHKKHCTFNTIFDILSTNGQLSNYSGDVSIQFHSKLLSNVIQKKDNITFAQLLEFSYCPICGIKLEEDI